MKLTWKKKLFVLGASSGCNHKVEGNMRTKYGVILAVIGYITFFSSIQGWGTDWKFYEANKEGAYFYDTEADKYRKISFKSGLNGFFHRKRC